MVHPLLSSVLYLTGASAAPKRLGESPVLPVLVTQHFICTAVMPVPSGETCCMISAQAVICLGCRPNRHRGSAL